MNMLVDELQMLGSNPMAWGAAGLLAVFTLFSVVHLVRCPLLARTADIPPDQARAFLDQPVIAGPRFLLLMLAGIAATLAGLTFIAEGIYPGLAFYLLLAGVFTIQTEPARLRLREAEVRVIAASAVGPAAEAAAVKRLRETHIGLIALEFVILLAVVVFLVSL